MTGRLWRALDSAASRLARHHLLSARREQRIHGRYDRYLGRWA
jgi:hypothetical protein